MIGRDIIGEWQMRRMIQDTRSTVLDEVMRVFSIIWAYLSNRHLPIQSRILYFPAKTVCVCPGGESLLLIGVDNYWLMICWSDFR